MSHVLFPMLANEMRWTKSIHISHHVLKLYEHLFLDSRHSGVTQHWWFGCFLWLHTHTHMFLAWSGPANSRSFLIGSFTALGGAKVEQVFLFRPTMSRCTHTQGWTMVQGKKVGLKTEKAGL